MQNYLSADVDERRVCKWVLVSRRATTTALCHLSLSGQQRQLPQKKRRSAKSRVG